MITFVDLMEATPLKWHLEHERMYEYWESNEWIMEPSQAGRRYQFLVDGDRSVRFNTSKGESTHTGIDFKVPHLIEEINALRLHPWSLYDCWLTNGDLTSTLKVLESSNDKAKIIQETEGKLKMVVIDVIHLNDKKIRYASLFDRKRIVQQRIKEGQYIRPTEYYFDKKLENYKILRKKYEYCYFKLLESDYVFGRSSRWKSFKEKKIETVVIMDVLEGKGKFENMAGSLVVGKMIEGRMERYANISSGMTIDDRIVFFMDKEKYINRKVQMVPTGSVFKKLLDEKEDKMGFQKTGTPQPMLIVKTGKCQLCKENEASEDADGNLICNSCKEPSIEK